MQIENLPLAKIDLDSPEWNKYVFTYPTAPGPILDSVRAVGLQQPLAVTPSGRGFKLVIGVKRALACRQLDWKEVPALVLRDKSEEELLWYSLHEQIGGRPLNAIEKSRVLQRFAELWQGDLERLQKDVCPLLGLPPTIEAVESYLFLHEMPEEQQHELAEGRLTPQHTDLLRPLRPDDRRFAAERLFGGHRVSLQEAREILENANGLAARDGARLRDIFEKPEVQELFVRDNYTPKQRTTLLRTWLHQERYPQLSALEKKFEELAATLSAGKKLSVKPPRDFEGDEIQVTFRAQKPLEIREIVAALSEAERKGVWKKLFALLQGAGEEEEPF